MKDREYREPTLAQAESGDGQRGDVPRPDSQPGTPNRHGEGLVQYVYTPPDEAGR